MGAIIPSARSESGHGRRRDRVPPAGCVDQGCPPSRNRPPCGGGKSLHPVAGWVPVPHPTRPGAEAGLPGGASTKARNVPAVHRVVAGEPRLPRFPIPMSDRRHGAGTSAAQTRGSSMATTDLGPGVLRRQSATVVWFVNRLFATQRKRVLPARDVRQSERLRPVRGGGGRGNRPCSSMGMHGWGACAGNPAPPVTVIIPG